MLADNLCPSVEGNLLVVHGTGDDNVHYQNTEALINALVEANKPFTMMAYPDAQPRHLGGKNTTRHVYELLTRYLREHVPRTEMSRAELENPASPA
jgi:dipeptidyl-peptidase-4